MAVVDDCIFGLVAVILCNACHNLPVTCYTQVHLSAISPTLQSRMASGSPAETPVGKPSQVYGCKCLNVQITSSTQVPATSPEGTCDPAYEPIFVDDEGIVIVDFLFQISIGVTLIYCISQTHPQVTVRSTTHAKPIPGTSRHSRFIVLTCLLCRLSAYRVFQTISLDIQGNESILLPTDDWVERDILKSSTGWIQVHKDGLVSIAPYSYKYFNTMNTSEHFFFWHFICGQKAKLPLAFILFQHLIGTL